MRPVLRYLPPDVLHATSALLLGSALYSCGGRTESSPLDGAAPRDAAPDRLDARNLGDASRARDAVARTDADIGGKCGTDAACPEGQCLGAPFRDGYCAIPVAECPAPGGNAFVCPTGSACTRLGGQFLLDGGMFLGGDFCVRACRSAGDCRGLTEGYGCCANLREGGVCVPGDLCPS